MDPLKLLRSLEEFLFEAIALLFFYPVTLFRIVSAPLRTMAYAESEEAQEKEQRYNQAVSPPLLLLLTLVLANAIGLAAHAPQPQGATPLAKAIFDSPQNLVLFRSFMFSLLPLVAAVTLLRRQKIDVSRDSLRPLFFAQCYLTVPFVLVFTLGALGLQQPGRVLQASGVVACGVATVWLLCHQAAWFNNKLGQSIPRSLATATGVLIRALVFFFLLVFLVVLL